MYDVIIRNGSVIDGTGARRQASDVGIKDGKIATVGRFDGEAAQTGDATGKLVTHADAVTGRRHAAGIGPDRGAVELEQLR